jgi:hypothetical protein
MNESKELFLPDTTVKLGTLRKVLNDTYGLDIIKLKMATNTEIASIIVNQLGGMGKLNMMTGAYNFVALPNGVTFRIKNPKANVIKITLTSMDLYDLEVGRLRGGKYTVVAEKLGLYNDMLKPAIEKATGMYLSLQDGGTLISTRRFTDYDFNKLMESGLFSSHRSIVLQDIYPMGGGRLLGKFNSDKEYLYISGKKGLSNPLVKWLSENSYVTSDEYRSLADGGGVGGTFDSSGTGEVIGGTFGSSESGEMIGGTMASSMYAKGSTLRASKSPLLEFAKFEDNWVINLVKLNPNRNQQGLLYKGGNKYAVVRNSDKGKQEIFEFKTLEQAEAKFDKLVTQSTTYSPISNKGKIEGNYANGGGIGGTSDSAEMDAPMLGGTMSSSMFQGGTYDNRFENKLWNEIADGQPHSFKKGGKLGDCGCKEKYDEGGNAECGCWHYEIGGL